MTDDRPRGRAAAAYANWYSWHVLPTGGETGKVPLIPGGVNAASADAATIAAWWGRWPTANVAVACGAVSGFWALDIDGDEGLATLADLQRNHGPLPQTPTQLTPRGGRHLLFKADQSRGVGNRVRCLPAIDTRDDGGFIVVAPSYSPVADASWRWLEGCSPRDTAVADAPQWLFDALTRPSKASAEGDGEGAPRWLGRALGTVEEGARNATLTSMSGHLLRRYVEPRLCLALAHAWNARHCRPALPDDEVNQVVESVAARELRRREGV
ncbi:MAG TPA: bifunctional DNA primase/polymerase [Candidatus Defluviicoccus seviourii]|nr:bifunctional DNA primase/polymerase [Candidatus Defluviicoccus seviourii]